MSDCPQCGCKGDYIPRNLVNGVTLTHGRELGTNEFYRCIVVIGEDIQSGPFYCGARAAFIAYGLKDGITYERAVCRRHKHRLGVDVVESFKDQGAGI